MARKQVPLRLDTAVYDAIAKWAADEARSTNAQIEMMLREQLRKAGRLPKNIGDIPRPGRPKENP
ncbi:hypothetical protein JJQ73_13410 [Corynebacterium glutamicum]|uniref:hypothetical protein n=1 Tax=Corynebacterium glutamicum TaxID=1718 RepID=UPI001C6E9168|nr:hypothetical protein [Corynebacterium glutamicum]QYR17328.1 hypothetical protein JJQ73_13410 [Corynebacterium glutamicum]